jgi:hypothetical protein
MDEDYLNLVADSYLNIKHLLWWNSREDGFSSYGIWSEKKPTKINEVKWKFEPMPFHFYLQWIGRYVKHEQNE